MFSKAIDLNPTNSGARVMMAVMMREQGDFAGSAKFLEDSLKLLPRDVFLRNDLGVSYFRLGETQEALKEFDKANELDPLFPNPYLHKAAIFLIEGKNLDIAVSLLQKVLSLTANPDAHRLLGKAYAQKGDRQRSLEEFLNAYNLEPNLPGLRDDLANILLDVGQSAAAEELCSEADHVGKSCSAEVRERLKAVSGKQK